jgi:hypothetical protein
MPQDMIVSAFRGACGGGGGSIGDGFVCCLGFGAVVAVAAPGDCESVVAVSGTPSGIVGVLEYAASKGDCALVVDIVMYDVFESRKLYKSSCNRWISEVGALEPHGVAEFGFIQITWSSRRASRDVLMIMNSLY